MNAFVTGVFTLLGIIIGVIATIYIAPKVSEEFKLREIYLAPFRKWCSEIYGELEEFWKRYLEQKKEEVPKDHPLLILDYRELHEVLREAPRYIGKIEKEIEEQSEKGKYNKDGLAKKFWALMNNVDISWHRLGVKFKHSLPAVDDVKLFEEHIKNSLSEEEQENIAKEIWEDMKGLSCDDMKEILDFLKNKIP